MPLPAPVPAKEALATLPDTRLWYWDTGGDGIPVVLVHPATGSALIWGYQQPAFAKSGYRVIGYSRRSYYGSDPLPKKNPGVACVCGTSMPSALAVLRLMTGRSGKA